MDKEDLIKKIRTVFADVPYPGDDKLITRPTHGEEPFALEEDFKGKSDWTVLDAKFLDQAPDGWGASLSFFSPEAYRFYLPAYLIADLEDKLEQQNPVFGLTHFFNEGFKEQKIAQQWGGGTMYEHTVAKMSLFTETEAKTVVDYLNYKFEKDEFELEREDILTALNAFWLKQAKIN